LHGRRIIAVFVVLTAVSLALGYWGLLLRARSSPAYRTDWWDLVYWDLQLFVLDAAPAQDGHDMPIALHIARFTAPAVTIYALVRTGLLLFQRRVDEWRAQRSKGHVVVCGQEPAAAALTRQLLDEGEKVVVVAPGADDPAGPPGAGAEPSPPPLGTRLVVGDARLEDVLRRAGTGRARDVMAVTSDSAFNVEVGLAVQDLVERAGRRRRWWRRHRPDAPICHAEIADRQVCAAMSAGVWHDPVRRGRLHFFSRYDRTASGLVERSSLEARGLGDPATAAVLIIGSGQLAQGVLLEVARLWGQQAQVWHDQGLGRISLPVRVLDPTGDLEAQLLLMPMPHDALDLTVETVDLRTLTTAGQLRVPVAGQGATAGCDPAHVFLCLDDDLDILRLGLVVTKLLPDTHAVAAPSGSVLGRLFVADGDVGLPGTDGRLIMLNVISTVYASGSVRRDHLEDMARAGHRAYMAAAMARGETPAVNPSMVPWEELPEDLREANRAQAADVEEKLAAIGCTIGATADDFAFTDAEVELLARREHDRWMAERRSRGWTFGPVRDDERKVHPKLVPWDELTTIDREKDRTAVRAIPGFFTGGLGIVRGRPTGG
jgi:voltage-gated potassium channel Kch